MSDSASQDTGRAPVGSTPKKRRRRPTNPQEQARRKAWAREWGAVGAEYRKARLAREGKP